MGIISYVVHLCMMFRLFSNLLLSVSFYHTLSGDIESAVEGLEALYTQNPDSPQKSIAFVYRKVLEANNGDALDKCKQCNRSRSVFLINTRHMMMCKSSATYPVLSDA